MKINFPLRTKTKINFPLRTKTKKRAKKLFITSVLIGFVIVMISPLNVFAADFKVGKDYLLYKEDIVAGNLCAAGANVTIEGNVEGDLLAAGANILVSGKVRDDLMVAGGTINISGEVGQDARVAGGNVIISSKINGDLIVAGGTVQLTSAAAVKGSLRIAGGNVSINGPIEGKIDIKAGELTLNSSVIGSPSIVVNQKFTITKRANINGDLDYRSSKEAVIEEGAQITGKINYTPVIAKEWQKKSPAKMFFVVFTALWLMKILALIVSGLIIFYFFKKETNILAENAMANYGRHMLRGFVLLFLTPIAIVISFVTLVGVPLGIIALFFYLAFISLSAIFSGIIFGGLLYKLFERKMGTTISWENIIVGIVALGIVAIIPFVGWIITFLVFLLTSGVLTDLLFQCLKPGKQV